MEKQKNYIASQIAMVRELREVILGFVNLLQDESKWHDGAKYRANGYVLSLSFTTRGEWQLCIRSGMVNVQEFDGRSKAEVIGKMGAKCAQMLEETIVSMKTLMSPEQIARLALQVSEYARGIEDMEDWATSPIQIEEIVFNATQVLGLDSSPRWQIICERDGVIQHVIAVNLQDVQKVLRLEEVYLRTVAKELGAEVPVIRLKRKKIDVYREAKVKQAVMDEGERSKLIALHPRKQSEMELAEELRAAADVVESGRLGAAIICVVRFDEKGRHIIDRYWAGDDPVSLCAALGAVESTKQRVAALINRSGAREDD